MSYLHPFGTVSTPAVSLLFTSFRRFVPDIRAAPPNSTPLSNLGVSCLIGLELRVMDQESLGGDLRMVLIE